MVYKLYLPPYLLWASLPFCMVFTLQIYPSFQFLHKLTNLPTNLLHLAPLTAIDLRSYHPLNLITDFHHTTACSNSLSSASNPSHIKEATNLFSFKKLIKNLNSRNWSLVMYYSKLSYSPWHYPLAIEVRLVVKVCIHSMMDNKSNQFFNCLVKNFFY